MGKKKNVFVTRDTVLCRVFVYPERVGIRKFRGCVAWGAAWSKDHDTIRLRKTGPKRAESLSPHECRERYGFYPLKGTAWLVEFDAKGKMKKTKVDIEFSN